MNKIIYKNDTYCLEYMNNDLYFVYNDELYKLTSNPYEPCLYVNNITIHNSLTIDEIESLIDDKSEIELINGKKYDINEICKLIETAIKINNISCDISYLEKFMDSSIELKDDSFYKLYSKYKDSVLDYCIVTGKDITHKDAVKFAFKIWSKKYDMKLTIDEDKMNYKIIDYKELFDTSCNDDKSYCYLFLNPPHTNKYNVEDFNKINNVLFPKGFDNLEIYDWSNNFSNYFDDGLEWWGARCISIYDKELDRFVIIGASATD